MEPIIDGMMQSSSIKEIAAALAKFIAQVKQPAKNARNPHFGNRYADLNAVIETASQPLSDNGLSFMQTTRFNEGTLVLRTVVMHTSGEWVAGEYPVLPVKPDPQGYGSAMTYARRYSLSAALGLAADDDDDGNVGSGKPATAAAKPAPVPAKPAAAKPPVAKAPAPAAKPTMAGNLAPAAPASDELEDLDAAQAAAPAVDGNPGDFVITIGKNSGRSWPKSAERPSNGMPTNSRPPTTTASGCKRLPKPTWPPNPPRSSWPGSPCLEGSLSLPSPAIFPGRFISSFPLPCTLPTQLTEATGKGWMFSPSAPSHFATFNPSINSGQALPTF